MKILQESPLAKTFANYSAETTRVCSLKNNELGVYLQTK